MDSRDTLVYYFLLRQLTQQHDTGVFFSFPCIRSDGESWSHNSKAAHKLMILQILDELDLNIINLKRPEKQMLSLCPAT